MKIGFVVDSGCDVPVEYVRRHNMTVVPLYINYGGHSYSDDGVTFDRLAYYRDLPDISPLPQTSAPSLGIAREMICQALESVDHLVCVTISADLSGTYNALRLASADLPSGKVTLWDSETLSAGGGWQAVIGAEVAEQTGGDLQAVLAAMKRVREDGMVYAALQNLEFLRRGGRINWATATAGGVLRVRPIVRVKDGEVRSAARLRTRQAWVEKVAELTRAEGPLDRIALLHTGNLADVAVLRESLSDVLPLTVVTITASPAIGTHTGPSGIGVATVRKTWRN